MSGTIRLIAERGGLLELYRRMGAVSGAIRLFAESGGLLGLYRRMVSR